MGLLATTVLASSYGSVALAQEAPTSTRPIVDANGVDVGTGRYVAESKSVSIAGLEFNNIWNGSVDETTFTNLAFDNGITAIIFLDGRSYRFEYDGDMGDAKSFRPVLADGSVFLKQADGHVAYTAPDGTRYDFTPVVAGTIGLRQSAMAVAGYAARLEKVTRPDGATQTTHYRVAVVEQNCEPNRFGMVGPNCSRTTYQRVQSITTNTGAMLKAVYASQAPGTDFSRLTGVKAINLAVDYCDPDADACTALSRAWPELQIVQATDANGQVHKSFVSTASGYTATSGSAGVSSINLDGVGQPNISVTNYPDSRVQQLTVNGKTMTYAYALSGNSETVTATDADGHATVYHILHDNDPNHPSVRLESKADALGNTTTYAYDSADRLYQTTYPEGNATMLSYDPIGRVTETRVKAKPSAPAADLVSSAGYVTNCTVASVKYCLKPLWTVDARGNRTDYTYSADHGEVMRVELPAAAAGQARPTTDYGYTQLYAKVRDASGQLVDADTPVWKLTSVRQCAVAATCSGSAAERRTDIEYGTGQGGLNLLPTRVTVSAGDGSLVSAESYAYDASDNVVSIDGPLPGSDDTRYFQWNDDRQLTGAIGPDPDGAGPRRRRAVRYTYDAGKPVRTEVGTIAGTDAAAWSGFVVAQAVDAAYDPYDYHVRDTLSAGGTTYSVTQYDYDELGRPFCTAVRMNPGAFGSLPGSACALGVQGPAGPDRITRTHYDAADRVTSVD